MTPSAKKGKKAIAIVGLDAQQNALRPEFAITCTLDSVVSRFSLLQDSLGKEEASWTSDTSGSKMYGQAWAISIHPDASSSLFATSGLGGQIRLLSSNVANFGEAKSSIPSRGEFAQCSFSPDGRLLASATSEGQIALFDSETGQLVQYWTGKIPPFRATFSHRRDFSP